MIRDVAVNAGMALAAGAIVMLPLLMLLCAVFLLAF